MISTVENLCSALELAKIDARHCTSSAYGSIEKAIIDWIDGCPNLYAVDYEGRVLDGFGYLEAWREHGDWHVLHWTDPASMRPDLVPSPKTSNRVSLLEEAEAEPLPAHLKEMFADIRDEQDDYLDGRGLDADPLEEEDLLDVFDSIGMAGYCNTP